MAGEDVAAADVLYVFDTHFILITRLPLNSEHNHSSSSVFPWGEYLIATFKVLKNLKSFSFG